MEWLLIYNTARIPQPDNRATSGALRKRTKPLAASTSRAPAMSPG